MPILQLKHFASIDPRTQRLRRRRARALRPVRPSRKAELAYRADLQAIVTQLRAAGRELASALRSAWPLVGDDTPPGTKEVIGRVSARFRNVAAVARQKAAAAARRNLMEVDERLSSSVKASIGLDIRPALTGDGKIAEVMRSAVAENVRLITSIPEQYFDRVAEVVSDSFGRGERWESMVGRISEVGDVTESRAKLIARDQMGSMNAAFNEVRQQELGIDKYVWDTAQDERVRSSHRDLNGHTFKWSDPPLVDGERAHPGEPIQCRCAARPLLDLDDVVEQQERQAA